MMHSQRIKPILLAVLTFALIVTSVVAAYGAAITLLKDNTDDEFHDPPKPYYRVGDTIHYTLAVTNPNPTPIIVDVYDDFPDGSLVLIDDDVRLEPSETAMYDTHYVVDEADIVEIMGNKVVINWLIVEGIQVDENDNFIDFVSGAVSKTNFIIEPCIEIEKTVDFDGDEVFNECETWYTGSDATWKVEVTNCGDSDLLDVMVEDTNGMMWGPFDLAVGETWEETYTDGPHDMDLTNTATAEALGIDGDPVGPVEDEACIEVIDPCIAIEKTVDFDGDGIFSDVETGPYDGTATWKIVVWNCGDSDLFDVMVEDTNGMMWGPFDLAVGESWEEVYDEANIVADKTNTATAEALDVLGNPVGPVEDDAAVIVEMVGDATRTIGFWKTHCDYTDHVFVVHLGGTMDLGWKTLTDTSEVFGILWSNPARDSEGQRRSPLCQAKILLSQQLVAAILNTGLDNGAPVPADPMHPGMNIIESAQAALAACDDRAEMLRIKDLLDMYNNSGTEVEIEDADGFPVGSADPRCAKDWADLTAGDCP